MQKYIYHIDGNQELEKLMSFAEEHPEVKKYADKIHSAIMADREDFKKACATGYIPSIKDPDKVGYFWSDTMEMDETSAKVLSKVIDIEDYDSYRARMNERRKKFRRS